MYKNQVVILFISTMLLLSCTSSKRLKYNVSPSGEIVAETTRAKGWKGLVGGAGDPFFSVIATKPQ